MHTDKIYLFHSRVSFAMNTKMISPKEIVETVLEIIGPAKRVVDLFSGCGTFALPISNKAAVHALESDQNMISALDSGWRIVGGLHNILAEKRDLFRRPLMPDEFKNIDAVVIDPPRAGAISQVTELAKTNVKRIAFVSCNPATFARDASILCLSLIHI